MKTFVHSNLCVGLVKNFVRVKTQTFWPIKYDLFSYYWVLRVFLYILNISSFIRYMTNKYFLSIYGLYSHSPNSVFFSKSRSLKFWSPTCTNLFLYRSCFPGRPRNLCFTHVHIGFSLSLILKFILLKYRWNCKEVDLQFVLISTVQLSDSVIHKYILFHILFHCALGQGIA